jgi:hypothetical protein
MALSNDPYLFSRHFGGGMVVPTPDRFWVIAPSGPLSGTTPGEKFLRMALCEMAAFLHHILGVVFAGAEKEMVWPDTTGHVAAMQAPKAIGDWSIMEFIRIAMGTEKRSIPLGVDDPVAPFFFGTCPQPAGGSFLHFRPKAFFQRPERPRTCAMTRTPLASRPTKFLTTAQTERTITRSHSRCILIAGVVVRALEVLRTSKARIEGSL